MAGEEIPKSGATGSSSKKATSSTKPSARKTSTRRKKPENKSTNQGHQQAPPAIEPLVEQQPFPEKKSRRGKFTVAYICLTAIVIILAIVKLLTWKSDSNLVEKKSDPNDVPLEQRTGTVFGQKVRTDLENYRKQQGATDVYTFVSGEPWKLVVNGGTQFRNRYYGDGVIEIMDGKGKVRDLVDGMRMDGNQFINVYMRVKPGTGASMTYEVTSSGPVTQPTRPTSPSQKEYVLKVQNNKTGKSVSYAFGKK